MLENKGAFLNTFERTIQASIASMFLFLFSFTSPICHIIADKKARLTVTAKYGIYFHWEEK